MKRTRLPSLFLALALFLSTAPIAYTAEPLPSAGGWQTECVDCPRQFINMTDRSLRLDAEGHPHVAYGGDHLYYAWSDGVDWHIETVDDGEWVGEYASLALDSADRPHISYYDSSNGDLKYARYDGLEWHIEIVDSEGDGKYSTSLALDVTDHPHISYIAFQSDDHELKYAWHNGVDWHVEVVDTDGMGDTMLVLDEKDQPHIAYLVFSSGSYDSKLKYAWRDGTNWHNDMIEYYADSVSLALDGMGRPHIAYIMNDYFHGIWSSLGYVWNDGTSWHSETIENSYSYLGLVELSSLSLALNGAGQPCTSYSNPPGGDLKYAWRDGTGWHIETVDSQGDDLGATSLALDGVDRPHISYQAGGGLKYAWLMPTLALNKHATLGSSLHSGNILTFTLAFAGLDSSVHLWDPLPPAVHYVPGSITSIVTPTAVYSPAHHAIVWQGTLPTGTVQTVSFCVTPDITVTKSLSSPLPIVNTAWLTETQNGQTITATVAVDVLPIPLSLDKQATPRDDLRNNDALTYTLTLYGPDLHVRLWDPLPPSVRYVSGTLASPAVYSPTAHAILWQGTLPTDTAKVISFQVTPGISGTGSLSTSLPIVNTAWLTATESGRSVSATVIVNGYYLYLPLMVRESL